YLSTSPLGRILTPPMRLGFHLSIGRGLVKAVEQGLRTGCEAAQIFSRNPRSWIGKPLDEKETIAFRQARRAAGLTPLAIHLPYLPNPASMDPDLYRKSIRVLYEELVRAELLGADYVVFHPGHKAADRSLDEALDRVAHGVLEALAGLKAGVKVTLLLENTAGQRGEIGARFSELAGIIERIEAAGPANLKVGVCLDTAHAWGAGYDLARPRGQDKTLARLDRVMGLHRLGLIHLNDSLIELGSRRDRHAPVGRGRIGARGLARLVRNPDLTHLAGIMETPRQTEADDLANMARAKRWRSYRRKQGPAATGDS
ncbi:MAG: deoxyribonuclease IV, partial [Thermodesulfobacteriota bacterium]|nr:deoxyribonuclease IV [Thermodesulfobacteriota bacterium]